MNFEGTGVAMITPFTENNEIDEEGYRENINFLIENGVDALLAAGTTGESATITIPEHKMLIDTLIDEVAGRVATIAGAGSNSTKEALELVQYAESAGADTALVITPYYNKPQSHGLIEHYKTVNNNSDIPIIVYNVPSRTGTDIDVETIVSVAELDNLVGIKEANPDMDKTAQIQKTLIEAELDDKFAVYSGNDNLTLPMMSLGAKGVFSVIANIDPFRISQMVNNCLDGSYEKAMDLHYELYDLMKILFIESNPVPTKEALKMLNRPAGHIRLPLAPLKDENRTKIQKTLEKLDLL
ncbi:4-hydroxy-tetrahydrodipicolinate synthase [Candidatus Methanobinarius endosymbioticus]|uniref:4-hydroxy-tetrahydrodipicolinate synthase n=1 Tax=Candidatus Methanobinarius endosymbioticus TaxID=2006182 RepID=A0A366ME38_9EURY|nr:4-hydroxy-tetrahydrodipicolinate synthase [Candidatus Methanobinarius endosymbioticus]